MRQGLAGRECYQINQMEDQSSYSYLGGLQA